MAKKDKTPTSEEVAINGDVTITAPTIDLAPGDEKQPEADPAKAEPKKGKAAKEAESTEGLVRMHKDGSHLHVHPTTVKAHESAGWKLA